MEVNLNFKLADDTYTKDIYELWKNTVNQRIFGLKESIEMKEVYVLLINNVVYGFMRFSPTSNKTNDYLKINELFLSDEIVQFEKIDYIYEYFFHEINLLIIRLGFTRAKITILDKDRELFLKYNWKFDGIKTRIANDTTFNNIVMINEISNNFILDYLDDFGKYLKAYND